MIKFIENFPGHRTSKKVGEYGFKWQKSVLIFWADRKKLRSSNQRKYKNLTNLYIFAGGF